MRKEGGKRLAESSGGKLETPGGAVTGNAAETPHHVNHRRRLRERFLAGDAEAFPDYELLELLLFHAVDRVDVKPLAKQLIDEFGGFGAVLAAEPKRLTRYPRMNERSVALFRAVREAARRLARAELAEEPLLTSWDKVIAYCQASMAHDPVERFRILFLNRKNRLIADEVQQRGTIDQTPVYPREVIKRALELGATGLILAHNHPSGDPTPSAADIDMTLNIRDAALSLGISLLDHVIVGRSGAISMKARGLI